MSFAPEHYSYSALSSFDQCPYMYYLEKIEQVPTAENAFAQHGSLCHDLLDLWAKGELKKEELPIEFMARYDTEVTEQYPRMLEKRDYSKKRFEQALDYFRNFDGFEQYDIIGSEIEFENMIEGRKFIGFIDLVLKEHDTGAVIICDHKSKSASAFKREEKEMWRQQYLYSKYWFEEHGQYPDKVMFNLFNESVIKEKPFDKNEYDEAISWAVRTMERLESFGILDFYQLCRDPNKPKSLFCSSICSVRKECK